MLTNAQSILHFDDASGVVHPDRLTRKAHSHYIAYAQRMLQVYQRGLGRTRRELHREVENICGALDDCPGRRIAAFCKLLDEASQYDTDKRGAAARLRQQVFARAAPMHPLVTRSEGVFTQCEAVVKQRIAEQLGMSWAEIDGRLFADVIEFQRLRAFPGYPDPAALLARYNIAQTQTALYRAEAFNVWSATDHKTILRYAKLARLMHGISRRSDGTYLFRFDGPASILRRSTRYGVAMARFLPGLLSCRDWRAVAKLRDRRGRRYRLELTSEDGLRSPVDQPPEFDSDLEAGFYAAWGDSPRDGWSLQREADVLQDGQTVFTPDFTLVHASGRRVLLEIVGYWTPEYLVSKAKTLARFRPHAILLAVCQQAQFDIPPGFAAPLLFKKSLKPENVLVRLADFLPSAID